MNRSYAGLYTNFKRLWNNALFTSDRVIGSYPVQPYRELKRSLDAQGIYLVTHDRIPEGHTPRFLLFQDLPESVSVVENLRQKYPATPFFQLAIESPLAHPGLFNRGNQSRFDHVFSYRLLRNSPVPGTRISVPCDLSPSGRRLPSVSLGRKLVAAMGSNFRVGLGTPKGSSLLERLGIRGLGNDGWSCSAREILGQFNGQLYTARRRFAATMDELLDSSEADIYGHGWDGRRLGYLDHIKPRRRYQLARGPWNGCKFDLMSHYRFFLCFENYRGSIGYVSEKIHEVIQAGSVPIYLGDQAVYARVPAEACLDARKASTFRQLILDIKAISYGEWLDYYDAGSRYLDSPQFQEVAPAGFSGRVTDSLVAILALNAEQ